MAFSEQRFTVGLLMQIQQASCGNCDGGGDANSHGIRPPGREAE